MGTPKVWAFVQYSLDSCEEIESSTEHYLWYLPAACWGASSLERLKYVPSSWVSSKLNMCTVLTILPKCILPPLFITNSPVPIQFSTTIIIHLPQNSSSSISSHNEPIQNTSESTFQTYHIKRIYKYHQPEEKVKHCSRTDRMTDKTAHIKHSFGENLWKNVREWMLWLSTEESKCNI